MIWIYRNKGGITAKKLGQILECKVTRKTYPRRGYFIVNYGQNCQYANLNRNARGNKLEQYLKLKEAGISEPRIFLKGEDISEDAFPLLARKKYHTQGKDIIYIHNKEELELLEDWKYDFLTEYIDKSSEYRVHILKDFGEFVSVKFNKDGYGDPIVRNHKNNWKQIEYSGQFKDELIELGKQVIDILGYDFGAVDIIRKKSKLYVLEVNSAPGLEPRKLEIYSQYFKYKEDEYYENL